MITSVTDPYGRSARFVYDHLGRLTNIVDMAGLSSSFKYDHSGAITNLVTPYGTNAFKYLHSTATPGYWSRGLEITEPTGEKQLCVYHDGESSDGILHHMHSYHWDRKQYSMLSAQAKTNQLHGMSIADFDLAPRIEWLRTDLDASAAKVTGFPWRKEGPVDAYSGARSDYVEYTYPDQNYNVPGYNVSGSVFRVSNIIWGSGDQMGIPRNAWGRPTEFQYYRNGNWVSFTNEFNADGRRLEKVWGPNGERVRAYGYDSIKTNLLIAVTNAIGEVIRYTRDSNARVTSISHPGGLITTNIL
jgi:hypothetical protein